MTGQRSFTSGHRGPPSGGPLTRCPLRWTLAWMGRRLFSLSLRPARVTSPEPPGQLSPEPQRQGRAAVIWARGRGDRGPAWWAAVRAVHLPAAPRCLPAAHGPAACTRPAGLCARAQLCGEAPCSSGTYLLLLLVTQGGPLGPLGRESRPRGARARPCCILRSSAPAPTLAS